MSLFTCGTIFGAIMGAVFGTAFEAPYKGGLIGAAAGIGLMWLAGKISGLGGGSDSGGYGGDFGDFDIGN